MKEANMIVTITEKTITIDMDADRATLVERDQIMTAISHALGKKYLTAKVSRYHLITQLDGPNLAQRTKFTAALADAFGRTIVTMVPLKETK